ncbi:hypothetical protein ebA2236 [Aromatoleum aromaticum EbN1]|uniref:Uncharacterized protein n=1 Tax=Aromatoleum aromaticum (strain DSM 19018 / LMG 30748 / EbN1) TaxID=76114 RepID=Q5P5Q5_AROAE|nr:hypothetical protein ebA2236 [Aromatoleum aromaticum EbN1]
MGAAPCSKTHSARTTGRFWWIRRQATLGARAVLELSRIGHNRPWNYQESATRETDRAYPLSQDNGERRSGRLTYADADSCEWKMDHEASSASSSSMNRRRECVRKVSLSAPRATTCHRGVRRRR